MIEHFFFFFEDLSFSGRFQLKEKTLPIPFHSVSGLFENILDFRRSSLPPPSPILPPIGKFMYVYTVFIFIKVYIYMYLVQLLCMYVCTYGYILRTRLSENGRTDFVSVVGK